MKPPKAKATTIHQVFDPGVWGAQKLKPNWQMCHDWSSQRVSSSDFYQHFTCLWTGSKAHPVIPNKNPRYKPWHHSEKEKKKNGYYHIFQVSVHFVHLLWNAVFVKLGDALCELFVHGRPLKIISNDGVVVTNFLNIQEILLMEEILHLLIGS